MRAFGVRGVAKMMIRGSELQACQIPLHELMSLLEPLVEFKQEHYLFIFKSTEYAYSIGAYCHSYTGNWVH
jgi:hypothetical protein